AKRAELQKLEDRASAPDFWNDQTAAQKVLQQRARVERAINTAENQARMLDDIGVLFEFAAEDDSSAAELRETLQQLAKQVEESETAMLLGGDNDARNMAVSLSSTCFASC